MKNNFIMQYNFLFIALALTTLMACKKYLDVEPTKQFDSHAVFSDVENARLAVMGVYDALSGDATYGIRISLYYPYDSDEGQVSGGSQVDNGRRGIGRYDLNPGNTELAQPWNTLYQGIDRANICIDEIPKMTLYTEGSAQQTAELKRLHGEVLTLRAQLYLELIRNWGDVPSPMIPSYKQTDLRLPKQDRDAVYESLLNDLAVASSLVPWRTEVGLLNADERITKGAVKALRARIALYRGGYSLRKASGRMERGGDYQKYYTIARDECRDILGRPQDHRLNPNYEDVFKQICALKVESNGEVLFEASMEGNSGSSDSKLGYYLGPRVTSNSHGTSNPGVLALPNYFYAFDSLDTRRNVSVVPFEITGANLETPRTLANLSFGKFRRDWRSPAKNDASNYLGYNWPIIRLADVYLMFAEADNELSNGPTSEAIASFEAVRKRGFGENAAAIGSTPGTKEEFFKAIVEERLLEFGGEGIRKYDLIRWNLLDSKIKETKDFLTNAIAGADSVLYPKVLFWKVVGGKVVFANSAYNYTAATTRPPSGFSTINWMASVNNDFITYIARSFRANHSELLPIPASAYTANPNLTQDYGY